MRRLASLLLLLAIPLQGFASELTISFLDVGQGDAALITSPTGKTVLIDGGPPEASERLLARLAELHRPIDLIMLSHRHLDHLGGLTKVVTQIGARTFIDAVFDHPSPHYAKLIRAIDSQHIELRDAVGGRQIDLGGGAQLRLIGPPSPPLRKTRSDVNANSVLARIEIGDQAVLFTGDAEPETERWLLGEPALRKQLRATVIKVPHHGGRYSSTVAFVAAVKPRFAIISVGGNNEYGHPAPTTIARWEAVGAEVLRTDRDGEITVTTDGKRLSIKRAMAGESLLPKSHSRP